MSTPPPAFKEKSSLQDASSTETPTVSLHVKYMCFLQLYVIHTAYQTCTLYCISPWEPIMLKPFTFTNNASVMKMELQDEEVVCKIWALRRSKLGYPSLAWNQWIWGEIICCSGAATFLIWSVFPLHTLLAPKNLHTPLARNHLRGLFQTAKAFDCLCFKQGTKAGPSFSLKMAYCVGFLCRALYGESGEES